MATNTQLTEEELLESLENFYDCFHELFEFMREHQREESLDTKQQLDFDKFTYRTLVHGSKLQSMLHSFLKLQSNITLGVDCTEYAVLDNPNLKQAKYQDLVGVLNRFSAYILANAEIAGEQLDREELESPPKEQILKKVRTDFVKGELK